MNYSPSHHYFSWTFSYLSDCWLVCSFRNCFRKSQLARSVRSECHGGFSLVLYLRVCDRGKLNITCHYCLNHSKRASPRLSGLFSTLLAISHQLYTSILWNQEMALCTRCICCPSIFQLELAGSPFWKPFYHQVQTYRHQTPNTYHISPYHLPSRVQSYVNWTLYHCNHCK